MVSYFTFRWENHRGEEHTRVLLVREGIQMIMIANYSMLHHMENKYETRWKPSHYLNVFEATDAVRENGGHVSGSLREYSQDDFKKMLIKEKLKS